MGSVLGDDHRSWNSPCPLLCVYLQWAGNYSALIEMLTSSFLEVFVISSKRCYEPASLMALPRGLLASSIPPNTQVPAGLGSKLQLLKLQLRRPIEPKQNWDREEKKAFQMLPKFIGCPHDLPSFVQPCACAQTRRSFLISNWSHHALSKKTLLYNNPAACSSGSTKHIAWWPSWGQAAPSSPTGSLLVWEEGPDVTTVWWKAPSATIGGPDVGDGSAITTFVEVWLINPCIFSSVYLVPAVWCAGKWHLEILLRPLST